MYLIDSSSPLVPGERPSNSSDERILMCASNASGVITSSAGLSFSAGLSAAKREAVRAKTRQHRRRAFITRRVVAVLVSSTELKGRRLAQAPLQQFLIVILSTDRR